MTHNSTSAVFRAYYSINSVSISDSGTYTCTVTNPIGSDSVTITVIIMGTFYNAYTGYLYHFKTLFSAYVDLNKA